MNIIDPHLHLFNLDLGEYAWLTPENLQGLANAEQLIQNFGEKDLTLNDDFNLTGFVHIEAGFDNIQPWREIEWLESEVTVPFKSIACIDLTEPVAELSQKLTKLRTYNSVVGVRHILDEQALEILSQVDIQDKFALLADVEFIFEVQLPLADLEAIDLLIPHIANFSNLTFVINHCGLPPTELGSEVGYDWLLALHRLSCYDNVAIKCSGWEMLDDSNNFLFPVEVVQHCIQNFGDDRVMLGSNFPLCLTQRSYKAQWEMSLGLTEQQKQKLYYDNTKKWYKF